MMVDTIQTDHQDNDLFSRFLNWRKLNPLAEFLEFCQSEDLTPMEIEWLVQRVVEAKNLVSGTAERKSVPEDSLLTESLAAESLASTRKIGRYTLLQEIGSGGMGTVWLAEQTEPERRRVALKLIKSSLVTHEEVARFEAKRPALAMMDHPYISKVFDGGTTETGQPYFVMEFVAGQPFTSFATSSDLPITLK